jgi:DNA-binding transcriptional MocR family regulator
MEQLPQPSSPESAPQFRYPEGWCEILSAPDALDYQTWMSDLTDMTQRRLRETGSACAEDGATITARWQQAIELVADVAIDPEDLDTMS